MASTQIDRQNLTTNAIFKGVTIYGGSAADVADLDRGPLFVWNNPSPASLAAGENAGIQVHIGSNPGATPAAGDAIGETILVTNENGRDQLWGMNIVVLQTGDGAGPDGLLRGIEVEITTFESEQLDPFQTSGGNPRKDGIEFVHNAHGLNKRGTAAAFIWSADAASAGMWSRGVALSRVADVGIDFGTWQGDTANLSFRTAAIYDRSGSAAVLKVDGSHGTIIDMSGASAPTTSFIKGISGADSVFGVKNSADFDVYWQIDSGSTVAKQSFLTLADGGAAKWSLVKNANNQLSIFNHATSVSSIFITAGDFIALGGGIVPTQILDINDNSIRVRTAKTPASAAAAGNAGQICWDSGFLYVCTATNTWKRVAIAGGF